MAIEQPRVARRRIEGRDRRIRGDHEHSHRVPRDLTRLPVRANSRMDIGFSPDALSFGQVKRGKEATGSMNVTLYGMPTTQITAAWLTKSRAASWTTWSFIC